jgi:hypothetical protein
LRRRKPHPGAQPSDGRGPHMPRKERWQRLPAERARRSESSSGLRGHVARDFGRCRVKMQRPRDSRMEAVRESAARMRMSSRPRGPSESDLKRDAPTGHHARRRHTLPHGHLGRRAWDDRINNRQTS